LGLRSAAGDDGPAVGGGWDFRSQPPTAAGVGPLVTLVAGSSFCVTTANGSIVADTEQGLFVRDTRVISEWLLEVNGERLEPLTHTGEEPFAAAFVTRTHTPPGTSESTLLVIRHRYLDEGMREDIVVRNLGRDTASCTVRLAVAADFADLFEVKEGRVPSPRPVVAVAVRPGGLEIRHGDGESSRGVDISASGECAVAPGEISWSVELAPRREWRTCLQVEAVIHHRRLPLRYRCGQPVEHAIPVRQLREWRERTPRLRTPHEGFASALHRGLEDLAALRIFDPDYPDRAVVAAGVPWFLALFGRDSLLTSWMLLPFDRQLALGTLQTLARFQGNRIDSASEEEPGRVLHEIRFGRHAWLSLSGGTTYYGTADATPLFVMLLGELWRWGASREHIDQLIPHADHALAWIERYGDQDGDGFVEYQRVSDHGLVHQGWKDSWDAITFADGRLADPPIALCEVQGYVYAAYLARAELAQAGGDTGTATHWTQRAGELKRAFNDAFWLPDRGWYAVALDRDKHPVDALTSNIGHCLWTGIVDEDKAPAVVRHLLAPEMFSGWGVRTLATTMGAYNPVSYHSGSVWPHDNALLAAGLMRYGFVAEAQRVAIGLLDAAGHFAGRLPELFCGFDRAEFTCPVPYPTSCSPQAWAAAAPVQVLRTLLRLDPHVPSGILRLAPAVPPALLPLRADRLTVADANISIDVTQHGWTVNDVPDRLTLIGEAASEPPCSAPPRRRPPGAAAEPVPDAVEDEQRDLSLFSGGGLENPQPAADPRPLPAPPREDGPEGKAGQRRSVARRDQ
jgi:glycogen debranching enzyme